MEISEMIEKLGNYLPEKRVRHSLGVAKAAIKLSKFRNCDEKKAEIAGILHDTAKYVKFADVEDYCKKYNIHLDELEKESTALSHSIVGSYIAKHEFGVNDQEILNAIRYHTTGRPNMDPLEEIVFLADLIEEGRNYDGVDELRQIAYEGKIDEAIVKSLDNTINVVLVKKAPLHVRTVETRNFYIKKIKKKLKETKNNKSDI